MLKPNHNHFLVVKKQKVYKHQKRQHVQQKLSFWGTQKFSFLSNHGFAGLLIKNSEAKMKQLNPFLELESIAPDFEFEAMILERNNREADMLIKKGYKIKKSVWSGLIAS